MAKMRGWMHADGWLASEEPDKRVVMRDAEPAELAQVVAELPGIEEIIIRFGDGTEAVYVKREQSSDTA